MNTKNISLISGGAILIVIIILVLFGRGCASKDSESDNADLLKKVDSLNQILADKIDTAESGAYDLTNEIIDSIETVKTLIKKKCPDKKKMVKEKIIDKQILVINNDPPVNLKLTTADIEDSDPVIDDLSDFVGTGVDAYSTSYQGHKLRVIPKPLYDKYQGNITPQLNDKNGRQFTLINNYYVIIDDNSGNNWCGLIKKAGGNDYYLPHEIVKDYGYAKGYPEDGKAKKGLIRLFAPLNIEPNGPSIQAVIGSDGKRYYGWHYTK